MSAFSENKSVQPSVPFILHESRSQFSWKGQGALSLKMFRNGTSLYEAGQGHFAVDQDRYLLLNEGQDYQLHIDSPVPVESFCLFFPSGFVEEISRTLCSSDCHLLDEPYAIQAPGHMEWVERTYPMTNPLGAALHRMRSSYTSLSLDTWGLEEQLYQLGLHMLVLYREVRSEIDRLDMVRVSTREEIYRRIHIAKEYMAAYYDRPITLAETASIAHLSVNHFLRSFKMIFGMTPYQFLTERRLQAACHLLSDTDLTITDVCFKVGFESPGSFSSLFSRRYHLPPSQY